MSEQQWDTLVEQLQDPDTDTKVRRKACQQLAALRNPEVIPFLRNAYFQDEDDRVRQIAQDALATFKTMQSGKTTRSLPVSENILTAALGVLAVLFVISLLLHVVSMISGGDDDDDQRQASNKVTTRDVLIGRIDQQLQFANVDAGNLRSAINQYFADGTLLCETTFNHPVDVEFSEADQVVYRNDLTPIAFQLNSALLTLRRAQTRWDRTCLAPSDAAQFLIEASADLDLIEPALADVATRLRFAIDNPPTPTPTSAPTYTPTPTSTPTPTETPIPGTATTAPEITLTPTSPPETATPTPTIEPTATLPFPVSLDYDMLLRELNNRYVVLGDLTNPYGTGMIDQWEKVNDPESEPSTAHCQLQTWPAPFALTDDQMALMNGITADDPDLKEAVSLQQQGLNLAQQARALYERDCATGALANSVGEGLAAAQNAADKLTESQTLTDTIRARPQ